MSNQAESSSGPGRGQKRKRNPDPYNDFGDGEYLGDEILNETNEVNEELERVLNTNSERTYRHFIRMSPTAFEKLLGFIKQDHVFFGPRQHPLKYQLALYLAQYGAGIQDEVVDTTEFRVALLFGYKESDVARYCACVMYALKRLPIHWLDELESTEKRAIKKVLNWAKGASGTTPAKKARF
ncbi:hypothetical protein RSOLAG22IIIB_10579 [Rhizoctonia solani]|uniref:Uncharacterized protein n=1 Tax=Rhizoctonia solani TaxID=456999 RepID=A0A0K6G3N6_9AGAM|nr:hypothetical protein RSOLAG22IIIB_10579 [Rhizoctonia solani]